MPAETVNQTSLRQPWHTAWPPRIVEKATQDCNQGSTFDGFQKGEAIVQGGQAGMKKSGEGPFFDTDATAPLQE